MLAELSVDHCHLAMLHNEAFNALDRLAGVVSDDNVRTDLLAMIINLAIEGDFKVDFSLRESKTLADQR